MPTLPSFRDPFVRASGRSGASPVVWATSPTRGKTAPLGPPPLPPVAVRAFQACCWVTGSMASSQLVSMSGSFTALMSAIPPPSLPFAGVHIVEATKQVYRAIPAHRERTRLIPSLPPVLVPSSLRPKNAQLFYVSPRRSTEKP